MAYQQPNAADELDPQTVADEAPPEGKDDAGETFFLPDSFPNREDYKPGDTITLKVVGADADGDLEVECVQPKDGHKSMADDLRATMGPDMSGAKGAM